jgi:hypothetical protein
VAATAGTCLLGRRLDQAGEVPVEVPPLTGAHIVMNVVLAEQERPRVVAEGVIRRVRDLLGR